MKPSSTTSEITRLKRSVKALKAKNEELEDTLRAIQSGEVDALVVNGPSGEQIFTLQTAEQPYRELVEAMNEGAVTVSPNGVVLYCNARFVTMIGQNPSQIIGSNFLDHVQKGRRLALIPHLKGGVVEPLTTESLLQCADGTTLPVQLSIGRIELVGTEGYCIVATDLSAQKRSAKIFQHQEWQSNLLNLLPVPLVLLEADLKAVVLVNVKASEILQHDPHHLGAHAPAEVLLHFEDSAGDEISLPVLLGRIAEGNKADGLETILVTNGVHHPILIFADDLPAMHGREPARLLMFQDISSIKKAQGELSNALRSRDQFMAALSHELRTPLNVILGWVQLLRANPADPIMVTQALDTLQRNSELQRDLIEDLLDMSRIITGNLALQLRPLDLKTLVRDSVLSLQLKADEKSIQLVCEFADDTAIVTADDKRIQQLIGNLIQNAIKFTPPQGRVVVSLAADKATNTAEISVADNGQGIDFDFLPHVFEQFKQENMSVTRNFGGLGLGLAICKTIVDRHHGTITALSPGKGRGATFTVQLPLSKYSGSILQLPKVAPLDPIGLKGLKVLVVDDCQDNLMLFTIWLEKCGAQIKTLESAANVVETLQSFRPDVLLSDISMPGEDGFALIAKVRALTAEQGGRIPAGAITANARVEDRNQALAAGYQLHISKPVNSKRFIDSVKVLSLFGRELHS